MGKGIILGIDFSLDFTQIAYLKNDITPTSISVGSADNYQIPTKVCYNSELDEWSIGEEAVSKGRLGKSVLYTGLPKRAYGNMTEESVQVLTVFMSQIIDLAKEYCKVDTIRSVLVTVDDLTPEVAANLEKVFADIGYDESRVKIVSHTESFVCFALNQNSDIWNNKVYMINYDKNSFSLRRMQVMKGKKPTVVNVEEEDLSFIENSIKEKYLVFDADMTNDAIGKLDEALAEFLEQDLQKNVVSAIYLVGQGFYEAEWTHTIKAIIANRRVFMGNNLIVKGAAYAAREFFHLPHLDEFLVACKGRTKLKITMDVRKKERDNTVTLSNIGDYWYKSSSLIECIMDEPTVAQFEMHDIINKKVERFEIDLSDFPKRPSKTTRIQVSFRYLDENKFEITIKDLGFGEFFEATDTTVSRVIDLEELARIEASKKQQEEEAQEETSEDNIEQLI